MLNLYVHVVISIQAHRCFCFLSSYTSLKVIFTTYMALRYFSHDTKSSSIQTYINFTFDKNSFSTTQKYKANITPSNAPVVVTNISNNSYNMTIITFQSITCFFWNRWYGWFFRLINYYGIFTMWKCVGKCVVVVWDMFKFKVGRFGLFSAWVFPNIAYCIGYLLI